MQKNKFKNGSMCEKPLLGGDAEKKIIKLIKKLQNSGFAPTRTTVRILEFTLAKGIKKN